MMTAPASSGYPNNTRCSVEPLLQGNYEKFNSNNDNSYYNYHYN